MRRLTPLLLAAAALAAPAPATAAEGDVLVRFRAGAGTDDRADARRRADVGRQARLPVNGLEVVDPASGVSVREAIARLEGDPAVLYAEPDVQRRALARPNDRLFGSQWGLENVGQVVGGSAGTADADIDATDAWEAVTGSSSVLVAVIDTGITAGHPDLAPNLYVNRREVAANGIDDDANGVVDDVSGANFTTAVPTGDPIDRDGHGTHVAGTVGARGNDGTGVTGVAWRTALLPVKALGDDGSGSLSDIIRAYGYATKAGARVVNLSLGGGSFSRAERDAIAAAPGTLFVAAAGNDGADNDVVGSFPCNHDLANVVCVAASDRSDGLATFSNVGANTVDLGAPGVAIASTYLANGYALLDGTSMATPHVAGAAALLLARSPSATVGQLRRALLESVDRRDALARTTVTGGRLNAAAAIARLDALIGGEGAGTTTPTEPQPATASPGVESPAPEPTPEPTATPPAPPESPATTPPAPPDRSAPLLRVSPSPTRSLTTLLRRRAFRVRVSCSERCTLRLEVRRRSTSTARIAQAPAVTAVTGTATVSLRLSATQRARLRRLRSVRLTLRVVATDRAGNRRTVSRRLDLRR